MFARVKKAGRHEYLQIVENRRENGKVKQRVISTLGRLDELQSKGRVETLVRSLSRFSEKALLILSGKSDPKAQARKIGPALIFERLWIQTGIREILVGLLKDRKFEFDVERAIFLMVLHRLMVSGSDRFCYRWLGDYQVNGAKGLELHHSYRAMAYLGEELKDQKDALFSPRRIKDVMEEELFLTRRNLFSNMELVFFDTTSIYFEGRGGETIGKNGHSKDHRPDLKQMVVGVVLDNKGRPLCCEMWPGNTTDVKTLIPIVKRMKKRFGIQRISIVADRGMISQEVLNWLESSENNMEYILGVRMRKVKEVKRDVLSRSGRYQQVVPQKQKSKDPSPLKVKEVRIEDRRYIVCLNPAQSRKDKADRQAIIESLERTLKQGSKTLVGNKGYRKYVKIVKNSMSVDFDKVKNEERFDGKWVLRTNMNLPTAEVALRYKELWMVEQIFRNVKSLLVTRPIYHQRDDTITGHVFCSFLALVLMKELEHKLAQAGFCFEWEEIKQDLKALAEVIIEESGKRFVVRTESQGVCGKVFQAVGVALPPTIRALATAAKKRKV
ncbi:MAG TPA: IS1634 family transposase [Candidatus Marinimicrobia bacterium]|nr:IS1634 family transposase [Candidatus Neomarinimicrobiota bacterium]